MSVKTVTTIWCQLPANVLPEILAQINNAPVPGAGASSEMCWECFELNSGDKQRASSENRLFFRALSTGKVEKVERRTAIYEVSRNDDGEHQAYVHTKCEDVTSEYKDFGNMDEVPDSMLVKN